MRENTEIQPSLPDEFSDVLTDICAVMARIILLAPPERQKEMCVLVLGEVARSAAPIAPPSWPR